MHGLVSWAGQIGRSSAKVRDDSGNMGVPIYTQVVS